MPSSLISVDIDQRSIARAKSVLAKYQGRPLAERLERGTLQAARMLVNPIRSITPVGPTGNLRRSIRAATSRNKAGGLAGAFAPVRVMLGGTNTQGGIFRSAYVGPSSRIAPHRHLVIRGHRIVTPGGRDTGRRTSPNPFVDVASKAHMGEAIRIVSTELFKP